MAVLVANRRGYDRLMADDVDHEGVLDRAMKLLANGIPLTLLIDLATPPHSRAVYREEPGDVDWISKYVA